jgi:hypothetical protein
MRVRNVGQREGEDGRAHQAAGVVLGWDGPEPVPRDGDHDPPAGGVGAASPDCPVCGECLIGAVLVVHPLHQQACFRFLVRFVSSATRWGGQGNCLLASIISGQSNTGLQQQYRLDFARSKAAGRPQRQDGPFWTDILDDVISVNLQQGPLRRTPDSFTSAKRLL